MATDNQAQLVVDSASVYSLVTFLESSKPCDVWSEDTAWNVTLSATQLEHFSIAQHPEPVGNLASDTYDQVLKALWHVIEKREVPLSKATAALEESKTWTKINGSLINDHYKHILKPQPVFGTWLDWSISRAWKEHTKRLDGVFNGVYCDEISEILNVPVSAMRALHQQSRDHTWLDDLIKHRSSSSEFSILVDAYVISALIRGKYHDSMCRKSHVQAMHHPFRQSLLESVASASVAASPKHFSPNYAEVGWAHLLLHSARAGNSISDRVQLYHDNLVKAKQNRGRIDLSPKESESDLGSALYYNAKQAGIVAHSKYVDAACGAAIGLITSNPFVDLNKWISAAVGSASGGIAEESDLNKLVARKIMSYRLKTLANNAAGRVTMFKRQITPATHSKQ